MRQRALHIAAATLMLASASAAQAVEGCATFLGDIRFCHEDIGLDLAVQEDLEGGGFLQSDDPEGTIVYVYVVPTALPIPENLDERLAAMDSGYLVEAGPGEDRRILTSDVLTDQPLTTFHSVRYSFQVDYGRVFALTTVFLDGLIVTLMTVEGGEGPTKTDAHAARHNAAVTALHFPKVDAGCHALQAGLQFCAQTTPWAGLTPFYIDNGIALTDLDDPNRDLLVGYGSAADPDRDFTPDFVAETNRRLAAAEMAQIAFSDDMSETIGARVWQSVEYVAQAANDTAIAGRSSTAIGDGVFTSIRTSRAGIDTMPLPDDMITAHQLARAALTARPEGADAWVRLKAIK